MEYLTMKEMEKALTSYMKEMEYDRNEVKEIAIAISDMHIEGILNTSDAIDLFTKEVAYPEMLSTLQSEYINQFTDELLKHVAKQLLENRENRELQQNEFEWSGKTFDEYMNDRVSQALDDYVGITIPLSELSWELTSRENIDGTMFYSTYKTIHFIKEYFVEIGDVYEFLQNEYDDLKINPFSEPEKLSVMVYIEKAHAILSKSEFIEQHWDEKVEITQELADLIKGQAGIIEINDDELEFMEGRVQEQLEQASEEHQQL